MATINDVYNEIDRIEAAKEAIEGAIEERGIEVPGNSLLGDLPPLIRQIPGPVQADWNEDDPDAPDFIKNKPTIPAAQIQSDWEQSNSEEKDFIKNKPTIPAAQVQSDWSESDSEKKSFIKNKPTIPAAQVQSDWGEQDSAKVEFIKNKPTIPTVPEISTNIAADKNSNTKTASPKAVYDEVRPAIQNSQPASGMIPNVLYNFGQLVGNATFLLAAVSDAAIVNHYYWMFDTPSVAPTITWPLGISWFGGSAPQISANKHYEVSVLNGIAVAMEV